jgi:hypothetical protein
MASTQREFVMGVWGHTVRRFLTLCDHASKPFILVINIFSRRQRIIFELNVMLTVTVTAAKMYSVFTNEVSSAGTDTPHSQTVQSRHSAAPWHLERQVSLAFNCVKHMSDVISCKAASLSGQNYSV